MNPSSDSTNSRLALVCLLTVCALVSTSACRSNIDPNSTEGGPPKGEPNEEIIEAVEETAIQENEPTSVPSCEQEWWCTGTGADNQWHFCAVSAGDFILRSGTCGTWGTCRDGDHGIGCYYEGDPVAGGRVRNCEPSSGPDSAPMCYTDPAASCQPCCNNGINWEVCIDHLEFVLPLSDVAHDTLCFGQRAKTYFKYGDAEFPLSSVCLSPQVNAEQVCASQECTFGLEMDCVEYLAALRDIEPFDGCYDSCLHVHINCMEDTMCDYEPCNSDFQSCVTYCNY